MRTFTLIIGLTDYFDSQQEILEAYRARSRPPDEDDSKPFSVYEITLPDIAGLGTTKTVEQIAEYYLFGRAFCDDWCADGTVSVMIEG